MFVARFQSQYDFVYVPVLMIKVHLIIGEAIIECSCSRKTRDSANIKVSEQFDEVNVN